MALKSFYTSSFFQALAEGLINPFIPVFALSLGASKTLIGLISALPNFVNPFSQVFWGVIADMYDRKKLMIIAGGVFWALLWIPVAFVKDPVTFLILLLIQAFLAAISVPSWTVSLINETPSYKRGDISANVHTFRAMGSFFGTIASGLILNQFGFIYFLFFIICFFGLLSRAPFLFIHLTSIPVYKHKLTKTLKETFDFSIIKREKKLIDLIKVMLFLNFATSIAGPFFSVYVIESMGGTNLDIAIISSIGIIFSVMFYKSWGTLIDYLGRKTIMLSCILPISFIPFVYAISNNIIWIYLYSIVAHVSWAGFNLAVFTYLSDVIPSERGTTYVATYNMLTGLSTAVAPIVGGFVADLTSIWNIFIISMILRMGSIYFIRKLEEKTGSRPRGIFNLEFDYFGVLGGLEMFLTTYSMVIYDFRKKGKEFINLGKYLKVFKRE
jgi:MFS family permease